LLAGHVKSVAAPVFAIDNIFTTDQDIVIDFVDIGVGVTALLLV
jgi:hypothetical protein